MSGSFGKGKSESQSSTQVDIPDFLRPFLNQGARTASGSLGNLQKLLGGDLVAGFTPAQQQAQQLATERAAGAGGFIPTAQNTILNAAQGQDLESFLPQASLQALTQGAQGQNFLPQESLDALTQLGVGGGSLPGTEALQQTAGGDFLFGGEGFDAAVDAATRAAQPHILSTFGRSGRGTGGLAQTAIAQSAQDAFARQFANERQNQLSAASQLANLGLAGQNQQLGALGQLAGINQGQQQQQLGAAGLLAGLGETERGRQLNAAGLLPSLATADINLLSGVGEQQQQLEQQQLQAPIEAQLQLLMSSLGGLPIPSLLGQSTQGSGSKSGFSFGF